MKTIEIKQSLLYGWEQFKLHYRVFLPAVFLLFAISLAMEFVDPADNMILFIIATVLGTVGQIIIGMGIIHLALKVTNGELVAFDDIFSVTHRFFPYVGASILYALLVAFGFLLLIVPGLIWLVTYWLFQYAVLDKEDGAFAALSEAKRLSRGVRWELFWFIVITGLINIAGALAFFVGLFITVPLTTLATAHVYRMLQKRAAEEPMVEAEPMPSNEIPASKEATADKQNKGGPQ